MERSDEALYELYRKNDDQEALCTLLERHREGLTFFLYGFVGNAEDAEELMLDAFAEIAAGPTAFSGRSSFKTWLFSVGKHLALKQLRRNRREISVEEFRLPDEGVTPEAGLLLQERDRQLYAALDRIVPEYREVLLLQYMEDMAPADIARVTGKRIKQVYNLIDRGKQALRSELERRDFPYETS